MRWTGERLVALAEEYLARTDEPLAVLWATVDGSRDAVAAEVREARGDSAVIPFVLREGLFNSPNAYGDDVLRVLEDRRDEIEDQFSSPLVLLVLTHEPIMLRGYAASPATLPTWIGSAACQTVVVPIDGIETGVEVGLDAPEVDPGGVRAALFELERSLYLRLLRRSAEAPEQVQGVVELLRIDRDYSSLDAFLADVKAAIDACSAPEGFRPGGMSNASIVSRIYRRAATWTLDQIDTPAATISTGFGVTEAEAAGHSEGILALMFRSNNPRLNADVKLARGLVAAVFCTNQLLNGVAHSAEYPRYPVGSIMAMSGDLKRSLLEYAEIFLS